MRIVRSRSTQQPSRGLTLLEMLIVVTLVGIVAAIVIMRVGNSSDNAKHNACFANKGNIELQSQLWFRNKGSWPAANLNDIFANATYFPDGAVTCPADGSSYQFDAATQAVIGHQH